MPAGETPRRDESPAAALTIEVLGPLRVLRDRSPVRVQPAMVRHLLALLALSPGQPVSREHIAAALWSGSPPPTYVNLLQVYASRLRTQLRADGPGDDETSVVSWERGGYQLNVPAESVDLARFQRLVRDAGEAARQGDEETAVKNLEAALGCWRGPVLADAQPTFQQLPAVVNARQQRVAAVADLARKYSALGRPQDGVDVLQAHLSSARLHEGLHAQLMSCLAEVGDRASALAVYGDIRARLADELGVDPGSELQSTHLRLLRDGIEERPAGAVEPEGAASALPVSERSAGAVEPENATPAPPAGERPAGTAGPAGPEPRLRWLGRRGRTWQVAAVASVLVGAAVWVAVRPTHSRPSNDTSAGKSHPAPAASPGPSAAASLGSVAEPGSVPSGGPSFTTPLNWILDLGNNLGKAKPNEQWASAYLTGLDPQGCGGFGFRLDGGPPARERDRKVGVVLAVCGGKWQILGLSDDLSGDTDVVKSAGLLRESISVDNVATITFNGVQLVRRQLEGHYSAGRTIAPAIYQADFLHVTMTAIRSGAS